MIKILLFSFFTNILFYSYGHLIKSENYKDEISNYNLKSILGVIVVSFIALLLNFFFPLDRVLNSLIFVIGILILFIKKKFYFKKNEIYYIIVVSFITASLIAYSNVNRPDAGLYHLPYTSFLNENKIIIGLSNIHFRFGHISIMQYLSAINNNIIFKDLGILIPLSSICSFFFVYFFNNVLMLIKKFEIDISKLFSLFVIVFITFKINRYSAFGNDAVSHLTFFFLISYLLEKRNKDLFFISLISVFAFLNKTTLILSLLFPIILFFKNYRFENFKIFYSLPSLFLILWFIKNVFISGCILYPIESFCINALSWTDINEIRQESLSAEAWSKSWPNKVDPNISMLEFNKKFNWIGSWLGNHGIYLIKIFFIYFLILICISIFISGKNSNKNNIKIEKDIIFKITYLISFIGIIIFFWKFPLFRYGYSYIVVFGSLSILILLKSLDSNKLGKASKIVFYICLIGLCSKQIIRYSENLNSDYIWPRIYSFTNNNKINSQKINFSNKFSIYLAKDLCMYSNSPCTNYDLKDFSVEKLFSYHLIKIKQPK